MLPVTCDQRQQPQPQTLPLLTPPLYIVGRFSKTEFFVLGSQPIYPKTPPKNSKSKKLSTPLFFANFAISFLTKSINFWITLIFLRAWKYENVTVKNPAWHCKESFMALWGVHHGSVNNLSWLWEEFVTWTDWLIAEPWQTHGRAMTDFSQRQGSFFQTPKTQTKKYIYHICFSKHDFPKGFK